MMIGMFDRNASSTIDFQEFRALWKYVSDWEKCFRFVQREKLFISSIFPSRKFDLDGSGTIDKHELKTALASFGKYSIAHRFDSVFC